MDKLRNRDVKVLERKSTKRKSIRGYINEQMKESLITGVPEIVSSKSRSRRAIKSIMFLFCTAGFLYQTYTFLEVFLKYETIQNFRMEYPMEFMAPGITFCSKTRINRELFCKAFEEECLSYDTREDFCNAAPKICKIDENTPMAVLHNTSQKHQNNSNEFLDAYGPQSDSKAITCYLRSYGYKYWCNENDSILIQVPSGGLPYKCFSYYSLFDKPNEEPSKISIFDSYAFFFNMNPHHLLKDKDNSQMYMYVHDPRHLANPIAEGITLNGGYVYTISLKMQKIQNLPPPYNTNCIDYMKKWKENGGRGPLTKKECIELCKIERMMEQHKCVGKSITYPHRLPICSEIITISDKVIEDCSSGCREACDVSLYIIAGQHGEDQEYEGNIELFSYIGGFIGIWLGISLLTFVDFLETVSDIIAFALMHWKKMQEKKRVRRRIRY